MNAAPPDDMWTYDGSLPSTTESEAAIAKDAEHARRHVAREYPGEMGKEETDLGKATWKQLGIEKKGKS